MNRYLPHQQRVVVEKDELDNRITLLDGFINSPLFKAIDTKEQSRLNKQLNVMENLYEILAERIAYFVPLTSPGPRGLEEVVPANTSGVIPMHVNVPQQDAPIESLDQFAALVDMWHRDCMENGNRAMELGAEGVTFTMEDDAKPGEAIQVTLDAITAQIFRVGAMSALNVFKDLPFGASLEDDPAG